MRKGRFLNFSQLRETFPHADQVGKFTVFNIAGNKVRLIAAIHYNRNKIYPAVAGPRADSSGVRRGQMERAFSARARESHRDSQAADERAPNPGRFERT